MVPKKLLLTVVARFSPAFCLLLCRAFYPNSRCCHSPFEWVIPMICSTGKPKNNSPTKPLLKMARIIPSNNCNTSSWHTKDISQSWAQYWKGNCNRITFSSRLSKNNLPFPENQLEPGLFYMGFKTRFASFCPLLSPMLEIGSISVLPLSSKKEPLQSLVIKSFKIFQFGSCLNPLNRWCSLTALPSPSIQHVINQLVISRSSFVTPRTSTPTGNSISV